MGSEDGQGVLLKGEPTELVYQIASSSITFTVYLQKRISASHIQLANVDVAADHGVEVSSIVGRWVRCSFPSQTGTRPPRAGKR
eukprot:scaffold154219_cov45-Cyclotella_meneghiniana.AAC.1